MGAYCTRLKGSDLYMAAEEYKVLVGAELDDASFNALKGEIEGKLNGKDINTYMRPKVACFSPWGRPLRSNGEAGDN